MLTHAEKRIKQICKNKKNVNEIQEIVSSLENDSENLDENLIILEKVFSFYSQEGDLSFKSSSSNESTEAVNYWLYSMFQAFTQILIEKLSSEEVDELVQVKALGSLMKCLPIECLVNLQEKASVSKDLEDEKLNFPNHIFMEITKCLIAAKTSKLVVIKFSEYFEYDDIRFYTLKNIHNILQKIVNESSLAKVTSSLSCDNICEILLSVTRFELSEELNLLLVDVVNEFNTDASNITNMYMQIFSSTWLAFIRYPNLPNNVQKKILVDLDTKIMPHLSDPKMLIDFLTDCYNVGGVNSILALNGLFVLINQFNLDYPDFYTKLYNLLSPSIFHVKYKSRFFHLLDLFLSSTHLPAYLVAAFTKKLSRMALFTPIADIEMMLVLIRNMLIRHPSSQILIHRKNLNSSDVNNDPYDYEEADPTKCNAIKSCLWELTTLKSHYSSSIFKLLSLFKKDIPKVEDDVSNYFDKDFDEIFLKKINMKEGKEIPMNFNVENEVFSDLNQDMWVLD